VLSIGEVSERTGLSVHALRFYERQGLFMSPIERLPNGRRAYAEGDVEWLNVCTALRSSGMPLATIRQYVELAQQGPGNEKDRLELLKSHQENVAAQIRELTRCLQVISFKVGIYEAHLAQGTADRLWNGLPSSTSSPASSSVSSPASGPCLDAGDNV
jgi:DNA-binding transcriptional MerR regulator